MEKALAARTALLATAAALMGALVWFMATMPVRFAAAPEPQGPSITIKLEPVRKPAEPPPEPAPARQPTVRPTPAPLEIAAAPAVIELAPAPAPAAMPSVAVAPPAPPPEAAPVILPARPIGAPPRPNYPPRAVAREKEGSVTLQLSVAPDGSVADVLVLAEDPPNFGFAAAAIAAVKAARFEPKRVDGRAVEGAFAYTVRFRLE